MADLRKLIEAVEAGTLTKTAALGTVDVWPDRDDYLQTAEWIWRACYGSLDAANALHDALVPGWRLNHLQQFEAGHWYARISEPQGGDWPKFDPFPYQEATNDNPARAWLLAILRAMEAEGQS